MTNYWGGRLFCIQHLVSNNSVLFYVFTIYKECIYLIKLFGVYYRCKFFACCVLFCYILISFYNNNNGNNENNNDDDDDEEEEEEEEEEDNHIMKTTRM